MIITGLTGGIGSGKTVISAVFQQLGVPVFNSDQEAKKAYFDPNICSQVVDLLGPESYLNNQVNIPFIAKTVFADPDLLHQLNQLIHPWVEEQFIRWTARLSETPYLIKESALLFETGLYQKMDKTICVIAPEETRIKRILQRDQTNPEDIRKRIGQQWPDHQKIPLADFLIQNDGKQLILPQILSIHQSLSN